jgi:hypothetical protein
MSLSRYENGDVIVQLTEPQYAQLFTDADLKILPHSFLIPDDPDIISNTNSQVHIYSFYGDYIAGNHNAGYVIHDVGSNSLLVDLAETFRDANIRRGSYIIVINLLKFVWGNPEQSVVIVQEISPDRTELKLKVPSGVFGTSEYSEFLSTVDSLSSDDTLNNLVIDFGFNRISKIVKVRIDNTDPTIIYLKLYKPLFDDIGEKNTGYFALEVIDPYVDTVILTAEVKPQVVRQLRGANYDLDVDEWTSNATVYKSWDDLLNTDALTTQRLIDLTISGSASARLNIDYTDFGNFIFYSSAEERVKNFYYKIGKIEEYQANIDVLQASTASITDFISGSVLENQRRIDNIRSAFDHFERWLYYEDTGSLFTHDISGSITPYPKYLSDGKYVLHHSTSSIVLNWYNGLVASASYYDQHNMNRLWWSIPEHIVMDSGNSDYVTFVEMVGQHFDNLYMYVKALTDINTHDEHPERGISSDLLWHRAKSFGWKLQNTRQVSDLWKYKGGFDSDGKYEHTGSLFSVSGESQTHQVWRRILNNLPYLLKTKGTARSVKALMSIYGIPQTLISIKEYGGPAKSNNKPQWIENRYAYALNFEGNQYVKIGRSKYYAFTSASGYLPQTHEFRFSTTYSGSAMTLFSLGSSGTGNWELVLSHSLQYTGTGSYSGSYTYGKLVWNLGGAATISSDYMPLYDGDMWTVRLWTDNAITDATTTATFNLEVARALDCTDGRYINSSSAEFTISSSAALNLFRNSDMVYLGSDGESGGNAVNGFSGSIQFYKEYYCDIGKEIFDDHVLNPGAYHLANPTSSFDYLYRYFPLGGDVIRYDHTSVTYVSSSQPNRNITHYTSASFFNFTGGQSDQYRHFRETYYIYTPSIGGENIRNNKIRIEASKLLKDLSPSSRSERSQFDFAPVDTNRLAIVFSMADQVNRDIFNQFGFDELDHWIGDPEYEFESEYSELKRFANNYFKKYTQKNDINAFIRLLSLYDYTFFEQIKQLIPARADLITGILVEPNILERSKVQLSKRPTVDNPQWDKTIEIAERPPIGEYVTFEGSASSDIDVDIDYSYVSSSIIYEVEPTIKYTYFTGSISDPVGFDITSIHHLDSSHQRTGIVGTIDVYPNRFSGSQCSTQSYVDKQHIGRCGYYCVIYHYSASGEFSTRYLRQWYTAVSKSYGWYYSRSLKECGYQIDECGSRNNSRFVGSKLTGADFNVDSPETVDGGPVVTIIESNPNNIFIKNSSNDGNLEVD